MPRRPAGLRQLVPLGGQAETSPSDSALMASADLPVDDNMYIPHFDAKTVMGEFAVGEMGYDMAVDCTVSEDEVDTVAQALLREYLNKKKLTEALAAFDKACPRRTDSITSRAKLRKILGLGEPNKACGVMEQVIQQRIADTRQGGHVKLGDGPELKDDTFTLERKPVKWTMNDSEMNISVGSFTIDNTGTKLENRLPEPKRFCDMVQNKIIDHFSDLSIEDKVKIGRGASGEVYGVVHKPTGKDVAVKVIKTADQRKIEEIDKELKLLFDNRCEYIVDFHGSFYESGNIWIVMERMTESLNHAVKEAGCMTEDAARSCVWQTLEALLYIHHERKVLHRDIKPANILFNDAGFVKLSDFGVSSSQVSSVEGNVANTFVGTLAYMSPERCCAKEYSFASDIWSLGLVLYFLVSGVPPYNTCHPLFAIIEGSPPDITACGVSVTPDAVDFYQKCVVKDPDNRPTCKTLLSHPWMRMITAGKARSVMKQWVAAEYRSKTEDQAQSQANLDAFAELDAELD
eukprot:TRINITY_DN8235_c0_g1_i1.p1 TRINITY_DN8235_c0_g1~~TRINITY_DN8235_c0_g1_i1.p1  ORF type:complete len:517 (+),score=137.34 TRINITY_DN8235_c0_g1_i1:74-1624(+)